MLKAELRELDLLMTNVCNIMKDIKNIKQRSKVDSSVKKGSEDREKKNLQ